MKYISSNPSNKSPKSKRANNSFNNGDGSAVANHLTNMMNKDEVRGDINDFYIER